MMDKKPLVLIVGAGPTGLMMACQLTILGIPFQIIEENSGSTTQSRALAIQARTLEIFDQMGIVDQFIAIGLPAKAVNYIVENFHRRIPIARLGEGLSAFPYLLMLEQSKTEALLIKFLEKHKKNITWSSQLVSLTQQKEHVTVVIKNKVGKEQTIQVDYVVGADGAHSAVRHALGIQLAGATYQQQLFVLDCTVTSPEFVPNEVYLSLSKNTFNAFFPLTKDTWRIVGVIPDELQDKKEITFEDIRLHFSQHVSIPVTLSDPKWISIYHSHHRCVSHFREGRCFLAGDSAHIHSPVGAQGMNTGLQDAYNLAWKLAYVLRKKAKPELLNTYNEERIAFAHRLVETTDKIFSLVVSKNIFKSIVAKYIVPVVMQVAVKNTFLKKFIFTTISQIGITYRHTTLSQHASYGKFPKNAPMPGDRVPFVLYPDKNKENINIQHQISSVLLSLFVFSSEKEVNQGIRNFVKRYSQNIQVIYLSSTSETNELYKVFGIQTNGYYLIRPDMYIACRGATMDTRELEKYLNRFFTLSS